MQGLSTKWQNLKDLLAVEITNGLVSVSDSLGGAIDQITHMSTALEAANQPAQAYADRLLRITDQLNGAKSSTLDWLTATTLTYEEIARQASASGEEKIIGLRREEYLSQRAANDEMRTSIALEQQRRALAGQALAIDSGKAKAKRGGGKGAKDEAPVANFDRFAEANSTGDEATDAMQAAINTDAYNESMQREMILREDRITLIEHEQELAAAGVEIGQEDAALQEDLAARKYQAEQDLLDFQIGAAETRAQILDLETAKRRKATAEQTRVMVQAQAAENKALMAKRAAYEKYGGAVSDVLGQVLIASIDAANGQEYATRKALAAIATGIRNQMIMTALKEFGCGSFWATRSVMIPSVFAREFWRKGSLRGTHGLPNPNTRSPTRKTRSDGSTEARPAQCQFSGDPSHVRGVPRAGAVGRVDGKVAERRRGGVWCGRA